MARADTPTLLSLDRFAEILGINPAHFNGATSATVMPLEPNCPDIYFQFMWQRADCVSREEIARHIEGVEQEIADVLGYYPAPKFIEMEIHTFPRHYRRNVYTAGLNVRGQRVSIRTKYGKIIQAGRRAVTSVELGTTVVFTDEDGDGYDETATITFGTTLTDVNEVKVYFAGEGGDPGFEIRHPRTKEITAGAFIATYFSWQLIDPDLTTTLTNAKNKAGGKLSPLDLTNNIYVSTVDVFREFPDFTEPSAQFFFENRPINILATGNLICNRCNGTGCGACELRVQDGCLFPRNVDSGAAVPVPAVFDTATGEWIEQTWIDCREADQVKLWYLAGENSQEFIRGRKTDPLPLYWAEAITWMTVARLPRPLCACGTTEKEVAMYRRDLRITEPDGLSAAMSEEDLNNPFGTRRGEVRAWKRVRHLAKHRAKVAVI